MTLAAWPREGSLPRGSRALVACHGESLYGWSTLPEADVVLAINSAAPWVGGDWLVAIDEASSVRYWRHVGHGVASCGTHVYRRPIPNRRMLDVASIAPMGITGRVGLGFSKIAAFIVAAWLGADEITVVGDDMNGEAPGGADRWEREGRATEHAIGWLRENCGVTVVRAFPEEVTQD